MAAVPYASAKAGLLGFTRQLAREVAPHGILVNSLATGVVLSGESYGEEMASDKRCGTTRDTRSPRGY